MSRTPLLALLLSCAQQPGEDPTPSPAFGHPFRRQGAAWVTEVPGRGIVAEMGPGSARVTHGGATLRLWTTGVGRVTEMAEPTFSSLQLGACLPDRTTPGGACLRPLEAQAGLLTERWIGRADGLQQTWSVASPPAGAGPLEISLEVAGATVRRMGEGLRLALGPSHALNVSGLAAWDADGTPLDARFEAASGGFRVVVDDSSARYPIEIDPLYSTAGWTLEESEKRTGFGSSLASRVDVNGDGLGDLVGGADDDSAVYITYGRSDPEDGAPDTVLEDVGWVVSGSGDFDGDGYADIAVGDPEANEGLGTLRVCRGGADGVERDCSLLAEGETVGEGFARSAAALDLNGDGLLDLVLGASEANASAGRVEVRYGTAAGLPELADLQLDGASAGDGFGGALARAGDTNGDGYDDLIIGAAGVAGAGAAYVYPGSSAGLDTAGAITLSGSTDSAFGTSVAGGDDLNGDGYEDVLVGAPGEDRVYSHHGSASGVSTTAASALTRTMISTTDPAYRFGFNVAAAGDLNGDGYGDAVLGRVLMVRSLAYGQPLDIGAIYVFMGSGAGLTTSGSTTHIGPEIGAAIAPMGDFDGDGTQDVALGDLSSTRSGGEVRILHEYVFKSRRTHTWSELTFAPEIEATGYGELAVPAGDNDGDGYADLLVQVQSPAAWWWLRGSATGPSSAADLVFEAEDSDDTTSHRYFVGDCDVNGDGFDDLAASVRLPDDAMHHLRVFLGGADTLSTDPATTSEVGSTNTYEDEIACAGDLDADGYDDLVFVAPCDGEADRDGYDWTRVDMCALVFAGSSSGVSSTATQTIGVLGQRDETFYVEPAGDVNGDGFADLALGYTYGSGADDATLFVYHGSEDGLEEDPTFFDGSFDYNEPDLSRAGDIDGDGVDDLVFTAEEYGDPILRFCLGSADGITSARCVDSWWENWDYYDPSFGPVNGAGVYAGMGDLDGDGADDVVVGGLNMNYTGATILATFLGSADGPDEYPSMVVSPFDDTELADVVTGLYNAGDVNGDGYADLLTFSSAGDASYVGGHVDLFYGYRDDDGDGVVAGVDCDDSDPELTERTFYTDADGDGFGDLDGPLSACEAAAGRVADATDCDDADALASPAGIEICDEVGRDEDCDGLVDDADADVVEESKGAWYADRDGDGHGDPMDEVLSCAAPESYVSSGLDCDDTDPVFHPGAEEACDDPADYDCDGTVSYADADGDGYAACVECDDLEAAAYPGAVERCDGLDNDCEGTIDLDAVDATIWYADADGDGHGDAAVSVEACTAPFGHVAASGDCDDGDGDVFPGAEDVPGDGRDEDCDGADALVVDTGETGETGDTGETGETGETASTDTSVPADTSAVEPGAPPGCSGKGASCSAQPTRARLGLIVLLMLVATGRRRRSGV